jgi:hypothetical protein
VQNFFFCGSVVMHKVATVSNINMLGDIRYITHKMFFVLAAGVA